MSFKISLAGDLGSGKSTVAKIITERTGATYYATGAIMREVARRYGMDIAEFNVYAETHPETDHEIDDGLVRLSDDPRDLIIDSRMAWHFTKNTFRVYMTTEPEISAARIMAAKRDVESFGSLEETAAQIVRRRASEKKRYQELYGVDLTDLSNYTLIVDTSYATPEEVAEVILTSLAAWQADPTVRFCEICAARLMRPADDDARGDEPTVFFDHHRFCLTGGLDAARDAFKNKKTFVSCRLAPGSADGRSYVRMGE
jgi:cytidylate kinase